ncbi:MAG: archease [Bacillota bacterium]|nr:archease [Bacillota bacterium]
MDRTGMGMRYEVFEHTADVGLRGFARTLEELFSVMAAGMTRLIVSSETRISCTDEIDIEVEGHDLESLMVSWLSELLFQIYTKGFLPGDIRSLTIREPEETSTESDGYAVSAAISGEEFRPEAHELVLEIKGVTYHMLEVEHLAGDEQGRDDEAKWYAQVILDI